MKPEVTGGTKTVLLLEWDSKINQSGFVQQFPWSPCLFFLSPVLVQAEVCAAVAPAVWLLEQLPTVFWLGAAHLKSPRPVFAQRSTSAAFLWYCCLSKQHSRRQKGCSTNSLLFKQCLKSQRP